jgi:hypothetical protein
MDKQKYFYVYYSYEPWGRGYIGKRECCCLPEDDVKYFGSYRDTTFKPTEKIILETFESREEAYEGEKVLHDFYEVHLNPHFANRSKVTSTGFYFSASGKDNPFYKGKLNVDVIEKIRNYQLSLGENHHFRSEEFRKKQAERCKSDNGPSKSPEAKQKMSISISKSLKALGDNHPSKSEKFKQSIKKHYEINGHPWSGRNHSEETKQKMKDKAKGRHLGRKLSEETKEKLRQKALGRYKGIKRTKDEIENCRNSNCKYIYTLVSPDGLIIETPFLSDVCKTYGLDHSSCTKVARGICTHHKRWKVTRRPRYNDTK